MYHDDCHLFLNTTTILLQLDGSLL
jgi:hypothetical protein